MKPIDIHIDRNETTRRYPRRVVWNLVQYGAIAFLGVFLALFCIHHDWTGRVSLESADSAHYIQNSPRMLQLSSDQYRQPLLHGSSFSLADGLQWSRYGLTRHIAQGQTIAVTIDRELSSDISKILSENGYLISHSGRTTTISHPSVELIQGRKTRTWALDFLNQGRFHDFTEKTSFRVRITDNFVQFYAQERAKRITSPFGEQEYRALWSSNVLPIEFAPLSTIPTTDIEMVIFEDGGGVGFRFKFEDTNLETEELAEIGKQYLLQHQLSTTAWTIYDGTTYDELRNDLPIKSVINQNDGITQLSLEQGDHVLRMTQTDEVLVLSNRHISLTTEEKPVTSSCLPRAQQVLFTSLIKAENIHIDHYQPLPSTFISPWAYAALARRGTIMRFCP